MTDRLIYKIIFECDVFILLFYSACIYGLSRKTMNTIEISGMFIVLWQNNTFATNQMGDKTPKDNRQTAQWISHDLTRNNEPAFSSTTNCQFYHFQILKLFFLVQRALLVWFRGCCSLRD